MSRLYLDTCCIIYLIEASSPLHGAVAQRLLTHGADPNPAEPEPKGAGEGDEEYEMIGRAESADVVLTIKAKGKNQKAKGKRQKGRSRALLFLWTLFCCATAFERIARSWPRSSALLPFAFWFLPFALMAWTRSPSARACSRANKAVMPGLAGEAPG